MPKATKGRCIIEVKTSGSPVKAPSQRTDAFGCPVPKGQSVRSKPSKKTGKKPEKAPPNCVWRDGRWIHLTDLKPQASTPTPTSASASTTTPATLLPCQDDDLNLPMDDGDDDAPFEPLAMPLPPSSMTATVGLEPYQAFWNQYSKPLQHKR